MKIKTNQYLKYLIAGIIIGLAIVQISGLLTKKPEVEIKKSSFGLQKEEAVIKHVVDGDTVILGDGRSVRLIGIDTPELHHTELPVQFYASEAADFTRSLCEGAEVTLEFENERLDSYNRTLAYIILPDGRCVNEEIIKRGYGYVYTRFPFSRMDRFLELEHEARANERGMWTHSPIDARVSGIITRYDSLNEAGKTKFDEALNKLIKEFPSQAEKSYE